MKKTKINFTRSYSQFLGFSSIIILLLAGSGALYFENQHLKEELTEVTHEAEILDAEVPDPVIKYAPLLVDAGNPRIKQLALSLGSPEKIYLFVKEEIEYDEGYNKGRTAVEVMDNRQGDCLAEASLLASLLLAYGYSEEEVKVSMGHVTREGVRRHHAWVEFNNKGRLLVLDASAFLGEFDFERWDRESFYKAFRASPYVQFNDGHAYVDLNNKYSHLV